LVSLKSNERENPYMITGHKAT